MNSSFKMTTHSPALRVLAIAALAGAVVLPAHAQDIVTFEFSGLAGNEATANSNSNDPGLTPSTISRGAGLTASLNTNRYNATSWALASIASAVSGDDYMEFTITPNAGKMFSVGTIWVQWQRSGTGNSAIALRSSLDSYAADIGGVWTLADVATTQTNAWTVNLTNSTAPVTYRLYSYAEAGTGSGGPGDGAGNDIVVSGTVSNLQADVPILTMPTVDPLLLFQDEATVRASLFYTGTATISSVGFVCSESFLNNNPVFGGPNTTVITSIPAQSGTFTNVIPALVASTEYAVRLFVFEAGSTISTGRYYGPVTNFNTRAPSPAFNGVYLQSFNNQTSTSFPSGWLCLSTSNVNSYAGDWTSTTAVAAGFYGRPGTTGIVGYLHTALTGTLINRLTLINNTGAMVTNLWVSYLGEVNPLDPIDNTRFPAWTVVVDGQTIPALAYSTASGTNAFLTAEITGLAIASGSKIVISWSSDRGTGSGASRMIGMTSVRIATNAPGAPTISATGSLTTFHTAAGNVSASQSFTASGDNLVQGITITAPTYYEVSTNDTTFLPSVVLPRSAGMVAAMPVYVRIAASAPPGNPTGVVSLTSSGAAAQNLAVTGTVGSAFVRFTDWAAGGPTNAQNVRMYAIGGATSPTANDGIPPVPGLSGTVFSLTALVRTNDPNLAVHGYATRNLIDVPWSTIGVSRAFAVDQSGVPSGTVREVFSVESDTNRQYFIGIEAILSP